MRLHQIHADPQGDKSRIRDLEILLEQPSYKDLRPCPGCVVPCPCSSSTACTCICGPGCVQASTQMSSEAKRYPIEERILPMVFYLNNLRVCPPYWSCEGHSAADGTISRIPQVWFYTRSLVYPRLMGDLLTRLRAQRRIEYPWHICVVFSGESLDTGFSMEPDMKIISSPDLKLLQSDSQVIASALGGDIQLMAREYISRYTMAAQ